MLAATNGTMVKIGTANAIRGGFRESILFNLQEEKKTGTRNHFEFPYDIVIKQKRRAFEETGKDVHLQYEKWVGGELRRLGNNIENEEFRMNFRLLWQEANIGAFDKDAFAEAADHSREMNEPSFSRRMVAGLDYARKRDATILTIGEVEENAILDTRASVRNGEDQPLFYKKNIVAWYEIAGRKWHDILGEVVQHLSMYSVEMVVADGTGVGDPLTERLQELIPGVKIVPFIMSHVGNDLVYKLYIQEMEAGRVTYPAGPKTMETAEFQEFVHEHDSLVKDRVGIYTRCEAPQGEHDDYCDSAALFCYAASLPRDNDVENTVNPMYAPGRRFEGPRGSSRAERYRLGR